MRVVQVEGNNPNLRIHVVYVNSTANSIRLIIINNVVHINAQDCDQSLGMELTYMYPFLVITFMTAAVLSIVIIIFCLK